MEYRCREGMHSKFPSVVHFRAIHEDIKQIILIPVLCLGKEKTSLWFCTKGIARLYIIIIRNLKAHI